MKVKFSDLLNVLKEVDKIEHSNKTLDLYEVQVVFSIEESLNQLQNLINLYPNNKDLEIFSSSFKDKTSLFILKKTCSSDGVIPASKMLSLYKDVVKKRDFQIDLKDVPEAIFPVFSLAEKLISPLCSYSNTFYKIFFSYFKKKEVSSILENVIPILKKNMEDKINIPFGIQTLYFNAIEKNIKKQNSTDEKLAILNLFLKTDIIQKKLLLKILNNVSNVMGENKYDDVIRFIKSSPFYEESQRYKEIIDNFSDGLLKRKFTENELYGEDVPENYSFSSGVRSYQEFFNFSENKIEERFKINKSDLLMISKSLPNIFSNFATINNCKYEIDMEKGFKFIINFESLEKMIEFKPTLDLFLVGIDNFVIPEMVNELKLDKTNKYPKNLMGVDELAKYGITKCKEFEVRKQAFSKRNSILEILSSKNESESNKFLDSSEFKL